MEKNSLSDLFENGEELIEKQKNPILLIDAHNLAYRTLFSAIFSNPEDNDQFFFWRHMFMNSLFNSIKQFKPRKVILAYDTKPTWRYSIYSDYKANRKEARDKAVVDFDKFFPIFNEFTSQIKDVFSKIYVLSIPKCEGDDIIATLCKETFKHDQVVIISSDGDMNQLINQNIKQYDPIKRKMVECINPQKELDIKVITGDKGDNIPPIKKKVGVITAEKILNNGLDNFLKESDEIKANYIRNKTLIDLNFIPDEIKKNIINTYVSYPLTDMTSKKILDFFVQNKLMKLMQSWEVFSDNIKSLE
jgi:DNA polymerase I